ncbi:MAG: cell fate (sporulation/competence/biofilm development) regulator YmcA (YheA/YmcA/DUF963 family) [Flavobacteriales bacterium]|jgi:cell fate (sporulation/competence/biofilm development) regulator YmcA (YheA/YmcA/DUF963 family)
MNQNNFTRLGLISLLIFGLTTNGFTQGKKYKVFKSQLIAASDLLTQMDFYSLEKEELEQMKLVNYIKKAEVFEEQAQYLDGLIDRIDKLPLIYLFRSKEYHLWQDCKHAFIKMKQASMINKLYTQEIPEFCNKHNENTSENKGNWVFNNELDPWIQDVYGQNIKPGLSLTGMLLFIHDYEYFNEVWLELLQAFNYTPLPKTIAPEIEPKRVFEQPSL